MKTSMREKTCIVIILGLELANSASEPTLMCISATDRIRGRF